MSRSDSDTDMDDDQKTVFDWCRCGRLDKIKEIFETTGEERARHSLYSLRIYAL